MKLSQFPVWLLFDPEDGRNMIIRNVVWLSTDCMTYEGDNTLRYIN
jgi:hypothetical protein